MLASRRRKLSDHKDSDNWPQLIMSLMILFLGPEVAASHFIPQTVTDMKTYKAYFLRISRHLLVAFFYFLRTILFLFLLRTPVH